MKYNPHVPLDFLFHIYYQQLKQIKKKTANIWEYKVGNNANIFQLCVVVKKHDSCSSPASRKISDQK